MKSVIVIFHFTKQINKIKLNPESQLPSQKDTCETTFSVRTLLYHFLNMPAPPRIIHAGLQAYALEERLGFINRPHFFDHRKTQDHIRMMIRFSSIEVVAECPVFMRAIDET